MYESYLSPLKLTSTTMLLLPSSSHRFDANATLNHSSVDTTPTLGPRGQWAGEGHYGLRLMGTAQVRSKEGSP